MERLEDGTYGICESCGQPIDLDRLRAMPAATTCVRCKELAEEEAERRRPVEEEVLSFTRSFTDGQDSVIYDGEDTWQDLAPYGTANSPQDALDAYIDADEALGLVTWIDGIEDSGEEGSCGLRRHLFLPKEGKARAIENNCLLWYYVTRLSVTSGG